MRSVFCFNGFNQTAIVLRYSVRIKPRKTIKTIKTENITPKHNMTLTLNTQQKTVVRYLLKQESRAVAKKPRDAPAVRFGLKLADNIHYEFKSSQASKARLQSSKLTGAKQNLKQNCHSGSFKVICI